MRADQNIVIVGGGPVGMVLALLLAKQNIGSIVLEARKQGAANQDTRALALSYGTRRILEKLGVWEPLAAHATAINTIHVSQKGSIGRSVLRGQDYQQEALGYVLEWCWRQTDEACVSGQLGGFLDLRELHHLR